MGYLTFKLSLELCANGSSLRTMHVVHKKLPTMLLTVMQPPILFSVRHVNMIKLLVNEQS